jgi:hypothetical protein
MTSPDNIKCDTPPAERRSLMEKVREKTENAKQRSKQWMHWLSPDVEEDEESDEGHNNTADVGEGDNNNTADVLPR